MGLKALLALLLSTTATLAHTVPQDRLDVLSKGVNVNSVFEQKADLKLDLERIRVAGFRHVRVFIEQAWVDRPSYQAKIDRLIAESVGLRLGVILTMISKDHPWTDATNVEPLWASAWKTIATRYRQVSPTYLYFEIANEPSITDGKRWADIQERLRETLRAIVPQHTLLLTGSPTQMVWVLPPLSSDTDVVYTWHCYQPMIFTVQGADWNDPPYTEYRGLIFPPDPANVQRLLKPSTANNLKQYLDIGKEMPLREVAAGAKWAADNHAAVMADEFGVYRDAPLDSRAAWLRLLRSRLEATHQGWTVWEYQGGFGIAPFVKGSPLLQALGIDDQG
jgi:endoglucanase